MKKIIQIFNVILAVILMYGSVSCKKTEDTDFNPQPNDEFRYSSVLQDNMVVQQEKPFQVWGKGVAGKEVRIKVSWNETEYSTTVADGGDWEYKLPSVPKAVPGDFTLRKIEATSSGKKITLQNLLIGDVWFFAGQSNMAMTMAPELPWHNGILNYAEEISKANYPNIRLFKTVINEVDAPTDVVEGVWQACSVQTVKYFSAVAYCMGETLYKELNIPVGLILSSKGAMSAQAFTSTETLRWNTELYNKYLKPYKNGQVTDPGAVPCQLYNGIIYPFRKLSLKGFGWYQGTNNAGDGPIYTSLCAEMVKGWRRAFDQDDLPFYYVQEAPYNFGTSFFFSSSYADLREWQSNIRNLLTNSDMVVTLDLNSPDEIHPSNKRPIGERLAALALKETYGQMNKIAYGPRYQSIVIEGGKVVIKYDPVSIGKGLSTKDGKTPNHFFIAGSDKKFYLAAATIVGNEIHLTAPEVNAPIAARYAYLTYPVTNFQNEEGFPAEPFRTDSWSPSESAYNGSRGGNDKQSLTVREMVPAIISP
jgi:sialate O-acetylesterase